MSLDLDTTMPIYKMPLVFKGYKFNECTNELLQSEFRDILSAIVYKNTEIKQLKSQLESVREVLEFYGDMNTKKMILDNLTVCKHQIDGGKLARTTLKELYGEERR